MKANELRIGNYVQYPNLKRPIRVAIIDTTETTTNTKATPIPLTEDILLKCGFTRHHEDYYNDVILLKDVVTKDFTCKLYPKELGSAYEIKKSIKIKYLHQLQNLYFAITNQELQIDL